MNSSVSLFHLQCGSVCDDSHITCPEFASPPVITPGYPELGGADAAWSESAGPALPSSGPAGDPGPRPARWPVLVYLLTVVGRALPHLQTTARRRRTARYR